MNSNRGAMQCEFDFAREADQPLPEELLRPVVDQRFLRQGNCTLHHSRVEVCGCLTFGARQKRTIGSAAPPTESKKGHSGSGTVWRSA